LFVADFIGDANVIDAELVEAHGEQARLRVRTLEINAPRRGAGRGPVKLAIRPEAISLSAAPSDGGAIKSRVLKAAYLGKHVEYHVETPLGVLFVIDHSKGPPIAPGTDAWITFASGGVVVVPGV
jgi:iron(III) transport system ATP-binding protein